MVCFETVNEYIMHTLPESQNTLQKLAHCYTAVPWQYLTLVLLINVLQFRYLLDCSFIFSCFWTSVSPNELESIPADLRWYVGETLDRSAINHKTQNDRLIGNFFNLTRLVFYFWSCGSKHMRAWEELPKWTVRQSHLSCAVAQDYLYFQIIS